MGWTASEGEAWTSRRSHFSVCLFSLCSLIDRLTHVCSPEITQILKTVDPEANDKRRPDAKTVHQSGLYCSGPDEEWCFDGHEKIFEAMGIGIYGGIDKFSRRELLLAAMRSVRRKEIPPALYLKLVKMR